MDAVPASLGSPVVLARALQVAREAGMDVASLRELHGHEAWKERGWIWSRIMRTVRVDGLPIRVAQGISAGEIGALGMAAQVAPDLRGAFQCLLDNQQVLCGGAPARIRGEGSGDGTVFEVLPVEGSDLGARCRRELFIASGLQFARDISGRWIRPRRVCFKHAAPRDLREHEAFFDTELRFGAEYDGLVFDDEDLAYALPGADADLTQFLVEHLRATAGDLPAATGLEGRVRQSIRTRLGSRSLAMSALARELGMSARTLRRRLLGHGAHYHEVLDRVRRDLAEELLGETDHKLAEIALRLGFSDASAFHRAYVRWTGCTPASRRRAPHDA